MLSKSDKLILEAYLNLPCRKLLNHQFEQEEDYLAGYITRFLQGERFSEPINPFDANDYNVMSLIASQNLHNSDGLDLLTAILITQASCNILNKYKK